MPDTADMSAPSTPHRTSSRGDGRFARLTPVLLVRAAHPRQAVLTAVALALAAAVSGRAPREVGLVAVTVLVGQGLLGWDNDLVDQRADEEDQRLFVQMQMEARMARREAEEAKRMAAESKQHYEATLAEQAEQRRMAAFTEVIQSDPVFTTYGKDPTTGKGLVEDLLADYVNQGADPATLRGIAGNIAARLKAQRDADIAAAKAEVAKGLKKNANAPATVGTRGAPGGRAPATGEVISAPPGAGFKSGPSFTKWLNRPSH